MSYLSRLHAEAEKRGEGEPSKGSKAPSEPFEGRGSGRFQGIPADLADGLLRLQVMPRPRITRPEVWPEIVADAHRLVDEGWAGKALALGWEPVHLWGCSPDKGGNPDHDGLAVLTAGRRVLLLDAGSAVIAAGSGAYVQFNCRPMPGAILLWEMGAKR